MEIELWLSKWLWVMVIMSYGWGNGLVRLDNIALHPSASVDQALWHQIASLDDDELES